MSDNSGPAFPTENERQVGPSSWHYSGLTKREYAAIKAMQGMLASWPANARYDVEKTAQAAVKFADAVLAESQK